MVVWTACQAVPALHESDEAVRQLTSDRTVIGRRQPCSRRRPRVAGVRGRQPHQGDAGATGRRRASRWLGEDPEKREQPESPVRSLARPSALADVGREDGIVVRGCCLGCGRRCNHNLRCDTRQSSLAVDIVATTIGQRPARAPFASTPPAADPPPDPRSSLSGRVHRRPPVIERLRILESAS